MMRRMIQINSTSKMTSLIISNRLRKKIIIIRLNKVQQTKSNKIILILSMQLKLKLKTNKFNG